MWKNYLKIAFRNLRRQKGYAFINVSGLALGMTCCLLILLFVRDELSYDRFHAKAERIYRIVSDWGDFSMPAANLPLVESLRTDYPNVEIAQLLRTNSTVQHEDRRFREDQIFFTKPSFFGVFTFPLLRGGPETALAKPNTVVITEETARKYFGDTNPIGQMLVFYGDVELTVTGVAKDVPESSHFHFDFLVSWATLETVFSYSGSWSNNSLYTYLLLPEGYTPEALEAQLPSFLERHAPDDYGAALSLQPLTRIHLHSHHNSELEANGRAAYVWIFSIIALFILVIACINFMNLATARSAERAKEVGVRKVVGAQRGQLVEQFLTESVLLSLAALVLALILAQLTLPLFNQLSGKELALGDAGSIRLPLGLLGIGLGVGVLAGSYPAFFLSRFRPTTVLGGSFRSGKQGTWLRKGLVVFQFALSVCLIVGTVVVYSQLEYLRSADMGFDQEQVITLPTAGIGDQYESFEEEVLGHPNVLAAARSSEVLPSELTNGTGLNFTGSPVGESASVRAVLVSPGFFEVLGVEIVAGRSFSRDRVSDSSAFVLNEAAYRLLSGRAAAPVRSPEGIIGKTVESEWLGRGPVIGVAQNFNMATLHEQIEPIVFFMLPSWYDNMLIRVQLENVSATLATVRDTWQTFFPDQPFTYSFVDQAFGAAYRAEARLGQIFLVFAGLAILIACLGLFGLAAYTAQQRTKEIGVRKVLGASVPSLVALLSKDFLKLVGLAVIIAAPLAYLAMRRWLGGFAYHIDLGPWVFVGAGALAVLIALLTVGYQAFRAATADPVKSLRYE